MIRKPTLEQFSKYQAAYDYFNRALFGGTLKPCLLVFRDGRRTKRGIAVGHFAPHRWLKGEETCHEISLNPETLNRDLADTMSTLVHEMCHQWQQDHGTPSRVCYHDRQWAAKMVEVGLTPSTTGQPGGKQTGQSMDHYIEPGGRFEVAMSKMSDKVKLPWTTGSFVLGGTAGKEDEGEGEKSPKNKIKYTCAGCKANVWGKPELKIVCGECDRPFAAAD